MRNDGILPVITRSINDFLFEEEGAISTGQLLMLGSMVMIAGLLAMPEHTWAAHRSHASHASHASHRSSSTGGYVPPTLPPPPPSQQPSPGDVQFPQMPTPTPQPYE